MKLLALFYLSLQRNHSQHGTTASKSPVRLRSRTSAGTGAIIEVVDYARGTVTPTTIAEAA